MSVIGSTAMPHRARTLMIMAGGTGGHIFPALSVAEHVRAAGWNVVWLGSRAGMEARLVPARGYTMSWIRFSGVRGKGLVPLALLPLNLLIAFWQSATAIFSRRPDVVLGMGGYVAFPGGMMASLFNRPLVIHEQNSVAGLTNRVLSYVADKVLVAFPGAFGSRSNVEWTGNPVRADIAAIAPPEQRFADRSGRLRVLVLGGSQGATALNEVVPQALSLIVEGVRPQVTHQAGAAHLDVVRALYADARVSAEVVAFIEDMAASYAAADLMICRAGASTIAELAAAGVAAVLVPFPYAVDDHQTQNARFLADRGGAVLIAQNELTPERLAALLREFTREKLLAIAKSARAAGKPDATLAVAEACMRLAA
ncbi:MAG TPA: undecaprenyldiphospho-muramoylpentapeptide beta-N-acetylglucosaminyltransferase [Burkholderiales bacterium]|nr:undecaprenyldiphospho-muramoylpentapeptide beta-N-acetylglucosaminyltransferase [Burkholderiales bacterium]